MDFDDLDAFKEELGTGMLGSTLKAYEKHMHAFKEAMAVNMAKKGSLASSDDFADQLAAVAVSGISASLKLSRKDFVRVQTELSVHFAGLLMFCLQLVDPESTERKTVPEQAALPLILEMAGFANMITLTEQLLKIIAVEKCLERQLDQLTGKCSAPAVRIVGLHIVENLALYRMAPVTDNPDDGKEFLAKVIAGCEADGIDLGSRITPD